MSGLRCEAWNVKAAKSFARHVKLDERRENGVVLDVEVFGSCHRHEGLDSCERHEASSWLLIGRCLFAEHVVDLIVGETCQRSAKAEKLSASKVETIFQTFCVSCEYLRSSGCSF